MSAQTGTPDTFLRLRDTPDTYAGNTLKLVRINAGETALEFFTPSVTSVAWGGITGTLSDQTDLQAALDAKQPLDGDLTALAALSGTHTLYYRSAANTWTAVNIGTGLDFTGSDLTATATAPEWGDIGGTLSDQTDLQSVLDGKIDENAPITGATKTKITYDANGLVTAGADATTADIADSSNKRYITDAQQTVLGNTSGTNTGDQTSIVGITGTKAQFDTAVTDGNILYVGDVTQYTDELAQDAVGGMVDTSLNYVDGTPLLQRAALTGAVTASAGSNTTALGSFSTAELNTALSDNDIVPAVRTLTINGDTKDLSADRSWTVTTDPVPNNKVYSTDLTLGATESLVLADYIRMDAGADLIIPSDSSVFVHAPSKIAADVAETTTTSRVAAGNFATGSTTAVDITGLTFATAPDKTYKVEAVLRVSSSDASGLKMAITHAGASGAYRLTSITSGTTVVDESASINILNATAFATPAVSSPRAVYMIGTIAVIGSSTGNITVQIAKVTAGTATVFAGSRMSVTPL